MFDGPRDTPAARRPRGQGDLAEVKALLQAQIEALCLKLAPEGKRSGAYWMCRSKVHDDKLGGMFVWLKGGAPGAWRDAAAGVKGDVIQLIMYREELADVRSALVWARDWLGLTKAPAGVIRKRVVDAKAEQQRRLETEAARLAKNQRRALALFIRAKEQPFLGSPADRYLQSRGIDVRALGRMPGALGWLPQQPHTESGGDWPVLLAGFSDARGRIVSVHRTWLARDGVGKAPVDPERKIWPAFAGSAARLWRGESGLSIEDAAKHGLRETLVLGEGLEDCLSAAVARPEHRIWAVGALFNLELITLPECIDRVIVCADNDWGKPQAARLLDRGLAALARQGAQVSVARSHIGKDVNNALLGVA